MKKYKKPKSSWTLPSGSLTKTQVLRTQVRRTPVPHPCAVSKLREFCPIKNRSDRSHFEPSTSTSDSSEALARQCKEGAPEEKLVEPSTSRLASSELLFSNLFFEKFYEPEEETLFEWLPLSPISESEFSNPWIDWKVKLDSEGSDLYFEEETSSSSCSENSERKMTQPNYIQKITLMLTSSHSVVSGPADISISSQDVMYLVG